MKSTPLDVLEAETCIEPIDLRLQELQRAEAVKLIKKEGTYFNKILTTPTIIQSPASHLTILVKEFIRDLAKERQCSPNQIKFKAESSIGQDPFYLQKLRLVMPTKNLGSARKRTEEQTKNARDYINPVIGKHKNSYNMFTDGSASKNPGPTGLGIFIQPLGSKSTPIMIAKAVSKVGTSYQGELEAIREAINYAINDKVNIINSTTLCIFTDSQSSLESIISVNINEDYEELINIRYKLTRLSKLVKEINCIYCPGHINIMGNEQPDRLAKTGAKAAERLEPNFTINSEEAKKQNRKLTRAK